MLSMEMESPNTESVMKSDEFSDTMSDCEDNYPLTIRDSSNRFTIFPLNSKHDELWKLYEESKRNFWFESEVIVSSDKRQWDTMLNDNQRKFLKYVLSFFAGSDKIVADNVSFNFGREVEVMEAQFFYRLQGAMEDIHANMYSILIFTFIDDADERDMIMNAIITMPVVKMKQEWAKKFSDPTTASFAKRLVAFAVVEGVYFSASFAAIFYFKELGILSGLCESNDFISRDEGLHCKFACTLYKYCKEKLSTEEIHDIFREAVAVETEFVREAIPVNLINLNADDMVQYIKFVADYWIMELGYKPLYNVENPLDFMKSSGMFRLSNFFERVEKGYQTVTPSHTLFNIDANF